MVAADSNSGEGVGHRIFLAVSMVCLALTLGACNTLSETGSDQADTDSSRFLGSFGSLFSGAGMAGPTSFETMGAGEPVVGYADTGASNAAQREAYTQGRGAVSDGQTFSMNFVVNAGVKTCQWSVQKSATLVI